MHLAGYRRKVEDEVETMMITELVVYERQANLLREAEAYRRAASRADRKQPARAPRRSLLAVLRHEPVRAVGCQA